MKTIYLSEKKIEQLAIDAIEISKTYNEEDIFKTIGQGLWDEGLEVAQDESDDVLISKPLSGQKFALEAFSFVSVSELRSDEVNVKEGKKASQRLKDKIQIIICNDKNIQSLFMTDNIKKALKIVIPIVLSALSISISLVAIAIIVGLLAIIIKLGYEAYCKNVWGEYPV